MQKDFRAETIPKVPSEVSLGADHVHLWYLHEEVHQNRQFVETQRVSCESRQILMQLLRENVREKRSAEQAFEVSRQQVSLLLRDMSEIFQRAALVGKPQKEFSL